jgi:hypothetical protein
LRAEAQVRDGLRSLRGAVCGEQEDEQRVLESYLRHDGFIIAAP